jgi:hypothetical protein
VKVKKKRRKKPRLHAITDHEQQKAQVADREAGMHPELFSQRDIHPGLNFKGFAH